jgi:hypothetical protein
MLVLESGYEDTRMTQQVKELSQRDRRGNYFAGGLSLGIALGLLFGTALGNPAIGLVIGIALGVALGAAMQTSTA